MLSQQVMAFVEERIEVQLSARRNCLLPTCNIRQARVASFLEQLSELNLWPSSARKSTSMHKKLNTIGQAKHFDPPGLSPCYPLYHIPDKFENCASGRLDEQDKIFNKFADDMRWSVQDWELPSWVALENSMW
jgi:hypothetical protein